ncbi:MAG: glycosyltransferase family 4 protein, partial [Aggregatilineales bacterium]
MKTLMVATNATPDSLRQDVLAGKHHRVDYFELADRLGGRYVDYNIVAENSALRRLEQKLRMDMRLAQRVARLVRREGYDAVLSLSERVGLPLAALLPREVAHLVIMHYAMSKPKIELIKVAGLARRWRKIMTLSDAESRGLEAALGLARGSAMTLRTPVDVDFYRPIDNVPLAAQDHIQSLGLSHRDYPTLLRAMRRLPDITCHLRVGSAWVSGRAGHENEALPPNVVLQPFVQPRELRACYARSRFIVVPIRNSTQWSAGCTSVQAAQAMGRAVIATAMPGLSEYL